MAGFDIAYEFWILILRDIPVTGIHGMPKTPQLSIKILMFTDRMQGCIGFLGFFWALFNRNVFAREVVKNGKDKLKGRKA